MKYNNGGFIKTVILVIIAVVIIGGAAYFLTQNRTAEENVVSEGDSITEPADDSTNSDTYQETTTTTTVSSERDPEGDDTVVDQPAYLVRAYSQNNKNYIEVDYIEILSGNASLQAQVADGKCSQITNCYDFPNGYKRNQNHMIRTFEVGTSPLITINGLLFSKKVEDVSAGVNNGSNYYTSGNWYDDYSADQNNHYVTFAEFKDLASTITSSYAPYSAPFKKSITYIRISTQNNLITTIVEPYQE